MKLRHESDLRFVCRRRRRRRRVIVRRQEMERAAWKPQQNSTQLR